MLVNTVAISPDSLKNHEIWTVRARRNFQTLQNATANSTSQRLRMNSALNAIHQVVSFLVKSVRLLVAG